MGNLTGEVRVKTNVFGGVFMEVKEFVNGWRALRAEDLQYLKISAQLL